MNNSVSDKSPVSDKLSAVKHLKRERGYLYTYQLPSQLWYTSTYIFGMKYRSGLHESAVDAAYEYQMAYDFFVANYKPQQVSPVFDYLSKGKNKYGLQKYRNVKMCLTPSGHWYYVAYAKTARGSEIIKDSHVLEETVKAVHNYLSKTGSIDVNRYVKPPPDWEILKKFISAEAEYGYLYVKAVPAGRGLKFVGEFLGHRTCKYKTPQEAIWALYLELDGNFSMPGKTGQEVLRDVISDYISIKNGMTNAASPLQNY